jgi:pimeloyl-ACP methyl ester carboxylesterase
MSWLPTNFEKNFDQLAPSEAGDLAFKIFCTPKLSKKRASNHSALTARARYHLRDGEWKRIATSAGELQSYTFHPSRANRGTVLLIHGWTGESSFLSAIAEQVRRAGFRVVLLDLPAHGLSSGRATNLMTCARSILEVGKLLGPLAGVIAHSFGAMPLLVAAEGVAPIEGRLQFGCAVLIASPNKLSDLTRDFCLTWNFTEQAQRKFEKRLERIGERPICAFATARLLNAIGCDALVIHCRDDLDVNFECAEQIVADVSSAQLRVFEGFGHRNLLFAPPVIRSVVSYLNDRVANKSMIRQFEAGHRVAINSLWR